MIDATLFFLRVPKIMVFPVSEHRGQWSFRCYVVSVECVLAFVVRRRDNFMAETCLVNGSSRKMGDGGRPSLGLLWILVASTAEFVTVRCQICANFGLESSLNGPGLVQSLGCTQSEQFVRISSS